MTISSVAARTRAKNDRNNAYRKFNQAVFEYRFQAGTNWSRLIERQIHQDGFTSNYRLYGSDQAPLLGLDLPGGPGTSQSHKWKENFDKEYFRMIFADWRGVGEHGPQGMVENNSADTLIDDLERLRIACGRPDEKMVIRSGSWGSTIALGYAARYPNRVAGMVMRLPFLATRQDIEWNYGPNGLAQRTPAAYQEFCSFSGRSDINEILDFYADRILHADSDELKATFLHVLKWEYARNGETCNLNVKDIDLTNPEYSDRLNRARILMHYTANNFTFPDGRGVIDCLPQIPCDIPIICLAHKNDPMCHPGTLGILQAGLPQAQFMVKDADWHWIAPENECPDIGYDNSFVIQGCAYACGLIAQTLIKPTGTNKIYSGVQNYDR